MSYTFRNDLFVTPDGPMNFCLKGCQSCRDEVLEYIEFGGGVIDNAEEPGPHTITLYEDEDEPAEGDRYWFKPAFILKSCLKNEILPLAHFRCSATNLFSKKFDPADILYRRMNWHDAQQKYYDKQDDESSSASSISEMSLGGRSRKRLTKATGPRNEKKARCEFTQHERKKIVDFIVNAKAFHEVRGSAVWKRMSYQFPNHTWQSLKEHFLKKTLPLITQYNLKPEEVYLFRKGSKPDKTNKPPVRGSSYSSKEDEKLQNYVINHASTGVSLGGNIFWQDMESAEILPGRSWHSMRERYLKHLKGNKGNTSSGSHQSATFSRAQRDGDDVDEDKSNEAKKPNKRRLFTIQDTPTLDVLITSPISARPSMVDILSKRNAKKNNSRKLFYFNCTNSSTSKQQEGPFDNRSNSEGQQTTQSGDISKPQENQSFPVDDERNLQEQQAGLPVGNDMPQEHQSEQLCGSSSPQKQQSVSGEGPLSESANVCPARHDVSASDDFFGVSQEEGRNVSMSNCAESSSPKKLSASTGSSPNKQPSNHSTPEILLPQWPSNFTPEIIRFVGDKEVHENSENNQHHSVPRVENGDILNCEDSDWSDDELFWCGVRDRTNSSGKSLMHTNQLKMVQKKTKLRVLASSSVSRTGSQIASKAMNSEKDNGSQASEEPFNFLALLTQPESSLHPDVAASEVLQVSQQIYSHEEVNNSKVDKTTQTNPVKFISDSSSQTDPVCKNIGVQSVRSCLKSPQKNPTVVQSRVKRVSFSWETVAGSLPPSPKYYPAPKP